MAEAVLYKAKSVADWSGAPGTLPLRAGDLVAVTSEAKALRGLFFGSHKKSKHVVELARFLRRYHGIYISFAIDIRG